MQIRKEYRARNRKHAESLAKKMQQKLGYWRHSVKIYLQEDSTRIAVFTEHEPVTDRALYTNQ